MRRWTWTLAALGTTFACRGGDRFDVGDTIGGPFGAGEEGAFGEDDRPVQRASSMPPPITGGTLIVLDDATTVVASDPDRDLVHVASLADARGLATIALEPGDQPGRLIADDTGLVHVALRGAGAIVSIDSASWTITARQPTCANPRGIAFDDDRGLVLVACAGGDLVAHTPGGPLAERIPIASDLRDVIVRDAVLHVSRFRAAEVLAIDENGDVLAASTPASPAANRVPAVAWRTTATPEGGWLMVHQSAFTDPIDLEPAIDGGAAYGVSTGGPVGVGCDGPVSAMLTVARPTGELASSELLTLSALAVDAAMSPNGERIAIAIAGQHDDDSPTMERHRSVALVNTAMLAESPDADCHDPVDLELPGHVVAVAWTSDDTVVAQSREPAELYVVDVQQFTFTTIDLEGESRFDTGHSLFHQDVGVGLACASCHPEGGDDGRVWTFDPGALQRRTQSLRVGLAGTEPFHWAGELESFEALVGEVLSDRMGAASQSYERLTVFAEYVFAIPGHRPERSRDDPLVIQGEQAFLAAGCATCHDDVEVAAGKSVMIRDVDLQVPPLRGIAFRPPYMHDGRAHDLAAAVLDMIETTAEDTQLTNDDLVAMVAYLESL
jgi:hypothetical protein